MQHNVAAMEVLPCAGTRMSIDRPLSDEEVMRRANGSGRIGGVYPDLLALRDRYADEIRGRVQEFPRRVSGYNLDAVLPGGGVDPRQTLTGNEGMGVTD